MLQQFKAGNEEEAHIQLELHRVGRMYVITQTGTCPGHLGSIPDSGEKCQEISDKHMWLRSSFLDSAERQAKLLLCGFLATHSNKRDQQWVAMAKGH